MTYSGGSLTKLLFRSLLNCPQTIGLILGTTLACILIQVGLMCFLLINGGGLITTTEKENG